VKALALAHLLPLTLLESFDSLNLVHDVLVFLVELCWRLCCCLGNWCGHRVSQNFVALPRLSLLTYAQSDITLNRSLSSTGKEREIGDLLLLLTFVSHSRTSCHLGKIGKTGSLLTFDFDLQVRILLLLVGW